MKLLQKTFETIDALNLILKNPGLCPTKPNIDQIAKLIAKLEFKVELYCEGIGL